jgi:leucyl aminopeptidase (aminopeptidase T)
MEEKEYILANFIKNHSLNLIPNDVLVLDYQDHGSKLVEAIKYSLQKKNIREFRRPKRVSINDLNSLNNMLDGATAYFRIGGGKSDISKREDLQDLEKKAGEIMVKKYNLKWTSTRFPSPELANELCISLSHLRDIYFKSCLINYSNQRKVQEKIAKKFSPGEVTICSPDTKLKFKICNEPHYCDGRINLPDGEVFWEIDPFATEGFISFQIPFRYGHSKFNQISLVFEKGQVIELDSNNSIDLKKLISLDSAAKYLGEFGIGTNPFAKILGDSFFDEKVRGTFHLALGAMYKGLESRLHLDMVKSLNDVKIKNNGKKINL